jgi:hypothetical protein
LNKESLFDSAITLPFLDENIKLMTGSKINTPCHQFYVKKYSSF